MDATTPGVAPPVVMDPWAVSVEDAARMLSIHKSSLYRAAKRGDFPVIRIGNRVLISTKVLNDWLENGFDGNTEDK